MSLEAPYYRAQNIQPEDFMRPPTESLQPNIQRQNIALEENINAMIGGFGKDKKLRLGSELELLIFSSESDPAEKLHAGVNPNYTRKHKRKVEWLFGDITGPRIFGGLRNIVHKEYEVDRIFGEIRIRPTDVKGYTSSIEKVREWIKNKSQILGIYPVVYSQHFHFSFTDVNGSNNLIVESILAREHIVSGMMDTYSRAIPFLRLPENVEGKNIWFEKYLRGVCLKGGNGNEGPYRLEGRLNSHSYAFDPYTNLFFNLIGIYRGLEKLLQNNNHNPNAKQFVIGRDYTEWEEEVNKIASDAEIARCLSADEIKKYTQIFRGYRDISNGKTTLREARNAALLI